jgi:hypothetical protein
MHPLRFVAGPIAAALLVLAPAAMPVFAQTSTGAPTVSSTATLEDLRYLVELADVMADTDQLLPALQAQGAKMSAPDAESDAVSRDLAKMSKQWQSVSTKLDNLTPTRKYAIANMHLVGATQGLADSLDAMSWAYSNRDLTGIMTSGQSMKDSADLFGKGAAELQAA